MTTTREHEQDGSSFGDPKPEPGSARSVVNEMVDAGLLDDLMSQIGHGTLQLTGEGGFLPEMIKAVLESGLQAEMAGHLGYEKGERSDASALVSLARTSSEEPRYVWETMRGFPSTRADSTAYRQVLFLCF